MPFASTKGLGSIAPPPSGQINGAVVESTNGPVGFVPSAYEMHSVPDARLSVV